MSQTTISQSIAGFARGYEAARRASALPPQSEAFPELSQQLLAPLSEDLQKWHEGMLNLIQQKELDLAQRLKQSDALANQLEDAEFVKELCFDWLMAAFLSEDDKDEEFLDSQEFEQIEARYENRGTELMNLLVYLDECRENDILPSYNDFVHEFLITDDEDVQEDITLYEDFLGLEEVLEAPFEVFLPKLIELSEQSALGSFLPVLASYFKNPLKGDKTLVSAILAGLYNPVEAGMLGALLAASPVKL